MLSPLYLRVHSLTHPDFILAHPSCLQSNESGDQEWIGIAMSDFKAGRIERERAASSASAQ